MTWLLPYDRTAPLGLIRRASRVLLGHHSRRRSARANHSCLFKPTVFLTCRNLQHRAELHGHILPLPMYRRKRYIFYQPFPSESLWTIPSFTTRLQDPTSPTVPVKRSPNSTPGYTTSPSTSPHESTRKRRKLSISAEQRDYVPSGQGEPQAPDEIPNVRTWFCTVPCAGNGVLMSHVTDDSKSG